MLPVGELAHGHPAGGVVDHVLHEPDGLPRAGLPPTFGGRLAFIHHQVDDDIDLATVADATDLSARGSKVFSSARSTWRRCANSERCDSHRVHVEFNNVNEPQNRLYLQDVARRWQFHYPGRFAAHYRDRFDLDSGDDREDNSTSTCEPTA